MVILGDVLTLDLDRVPVQRDVTYAMVGVYSFGRGLFCREALSGNNTTYRTFFRLSADHVVMSQLFGWEGALALSSPQFEGKFVSPQFPTFRCDPDRLDRDFLGWIIRRRSFWHALSEKASGMGDRRRTLNPDALLGCQIPLPPLWQQRQLVANFNLMEHRISVIRELRVKVEDQMNNLVASANIGYSEGRTIQLGRGLRLNEDRVEIETGKSYKQAGIRGFGLGLFAKESVGADETTYRYFNRLQREMFVLSQVKGWEGAVAVCTKVHDGLFVSPEYRTFSCDESELRPAYFSNICRTPWFHGYLKDLTKGQGARRERLRPEMLLELEIPLPRVELQKNLEGVFSQAATIKQHHSETENQLESLLEATVETALKEL
jgi:type I restriction enzyme S subunit